jgi:hypothetical protein
MAHSWFRKWVNRKSRKSSSAGDPARRPMRRWVPLSLERLEDRTLLDAPAGAGQLFNLSSSSSTGSLYLRESAGYIQYSTDDATWANFQPIAGTGPIQINQTTLQTALGTGTTVPGAYVFVGSITTNGRELDVSAPGSIEVQSGVVLSTQNTSFQIGAGVVSQSDSGALSLDVENPQGVLVSSAAPHITIDSGAQLLANAVNSAVSNYAAGNVTLKVVASQLSLNVPILANLGADTQTASLDVNSGATIRGKDVTISAQAGDVNPLDTIDQNINNANGSLAGLLKSVLTYATDYLSLPLSIQFKSPSAEVTLAPTASVTSSGATNVTSEADADATGEATFAHDVSGFGAAFGFNWASPTATTTIQSNASIAAVGLVNVGSTVNSTAVGTARVTQNSGPGFLKNETVAPYSQRFNYNDSQTKSLSGPFTTDPNRIQVAGVVAVDELKSITTVQKNASITSDSNVTVQALGTYTGSATASTGAYFDGRSGLGFAVGYSTSTIQANVDGKITVTGHTSAGAKDVINPYKAVNFAKNTIHFDTADGFQTGDPLTYSSGGGGDIPGLQSGTTYYVIVVDPQTIQLAAGTDDATNGTFIAFNPYPTLTDGPLSVPITNVNDITNTIEYAYDTGIKPGDQVTYGAVAGQAVGGLTGGQTYTVVAGGDSGNPFAFQLKDATGTLVQFNRRPTLTEAGGTALDFNVGTDANTIDLRGQTFTPAVDATSNTLDLAYSHGFTTGEKVVYDNGGGTSIGVKNSDGSTGTLTQGATYLAVVDPSQPTRLGLKDLSGNRITLLDPGSTSLGADQRFTALTATQVQTGDALTYHGVLGLTLSGLTDGTTYYAIANPYNSGVIYLAASKANATAAGAAGQQAHDSALTTFDQGIHDDAVNDYLHNINPNGTQDQANAYADGIVANDGASILQIYLSQNPGQESLWFASGAAAARDGGGTPIVVPFTASAAIMSGVLHSFTPGNSGITITAQLTASDTGVVISGLGGEPVVSDALTKGELAPALPGIFKGLTGGDGFTQTNIVKNLPKQADGSPTQSEGPDFSLSGAFAVLYTNNNVLADVGPDAVLKTTQSVAVSSSISDSIDNYIDASISKPEDSTTSVSIAAGVGVGIFNNSAVTKIEDGAHIDATNAFTATSSLSYPFLFPTDASSAASTFGSNVIGDVASFLYGKLGLDSYLFNSWIRTGVNTAKGDYGIAGAIGVDVYTNVAQTLVGNAFINQDAAYRNPNLAQTVAFDANNTIDSVDQTGIFELNLLPEQISKLKEEGIGTLGGVGSEAGKGSVGGALFVMVANNTTTTKVAGGAQIYTAMPAANLTTFTPTLSGDTLDLGYAHGFTTGEPIFYDNSGDKSTDVGGLQRGHSYYAIVDPNNPNTLQLAASSADATAIVPVPVKLTSAGSGSGHSFTPAALSVTAETSNIEVSLAADGGSANNFSVSGTFSVLVFTNHTTAQVDAGARITGPTGVGDAGGLNIDAQDATDLINLAGTVSKGGRAGFGFTATVNVLDRTTLALLGANPNDSHDALAASSVHLGGDLGINAENAGVLVTASFAAAIQATPEEMGDSQPAGGSKSVSWAPVIETVIPEGIGAAKNGLDIAGKASQAVGSATGGETEGEDSGIGVSGDASLNEVVHDTADAFVNESAGSAANPNVSAANVTVTAENQTVVAALAGAVAVAGGTSSETGVAGSFTQNTLIGETKAYVSGAVIQDGGALTVIATRGGYIGSLTAGAAAATGTDSKGVAGSVSVNIITDQVDAYLVNDNVQLAGDLEVNATDASLIVSVAGGVGYGGKAGVGLAIAVNVVTNTTTGYIDASTVNQTGGGLDVTASNENPTTDARIVALTGTVGVSSQGNGVAGMIGVNVVTDTTDAHLSNTTYTNTNLDPTGNGANVEALDHSWIVSLGFAVGVGKDTSVGGAISVNVIADTVSAHLDDTKFTTGGSLTVHAETGGTIGAGTVGVAGSGSGNGVAGSLSVNVLDNTTKAYVTGDSNPGRPTTVSAAGPVQITASDQSLIVSVAGGVGISLSGSAVGGALSGNAISNHTNAYVNDATVQATGAGSGLTVSASETSTIVAVSVGAAVGKDTSGSGSITVNVIDNTTTAYVQASPAGAGGSPAVEAAGDVQITATDGSTIIDVSGAIAGSGGGSAFGGSLSVNLMLNHTDASIDGSAVQSDSGGVLVSAGWAPAGALPTSFTLGNSSGSGSFSVSLPAIPDQVKGSVVSVSVSGTAGNWTAIAGAVPINIISNEVKSSITGSTVTASGDVLVLASDHSTIGSGALGLSVGQNAGGATLGTSDVLNHVSAYIEKSAVTTTGTGGVGVEATEEAKTITIAFGVAAAGNFALGGSVGVNVSDNVVDAHISTGSTVQSVGTVEVKATDTTSVFAGTGGLAAAGGAAAGAALASNDIADTITAYIDASSVSASAGDVRVEATSTPTVGSGTVGGTASLDVAVAGSITVSVIDDTTKAYVSGATTKVTADGNLVVSAFQDLNAGIGSGGFAGAGEVAVGLANTTIITNDLTEAYIGTGVTALGRGNGAAYPAYTGKKDGTGAPVTEDFHGVSVTSVSFQEVLSLAVGGAGGGTAGIAGSATVEVLSETSKAHVDAGAQINVQTAAPNADQGVNIHATNTTRVQSGAGGVGGGGEVGIGAGIDVGVITKHTEAYVADASATTHYFGAQSVDTLTNAIKVGATNPFTSGEAVVYHNGGGTSIPTLTDGGTYYVITNSSYPTEIQLAATAGGNAIALPSGGSSSSQSLTPLGVTFGPSAVDGTNKTITVGLPNPFTSGAAVVYHNGGGTSIPTLTDGGTYYAIPSPSDPTKVRLAATPADAATGNALALPSGSTSSSQSLTPAGVTFGPSGVTTGPLAINVGAGNSFTTGEAVVYHGGGGGIPGLADSQTYYVITNSAQPWAVQLAATKTDATAGNAIALPSGGTSSSQSLTAAGGTPVVFGPSNVVPIGLPDTINLGSNHGFVTGQPVVYDNGGGTAIGVRNGDGSSGTLNSGGAVYYVIVVDAQTVELAASPDDATSGKAITLTANGTGTSQSLRAVNGGVSGPAFGPADVVTSGQANSINTVSPHGFTGGQAVVYGDGGGTDAGGLTNGHVYYAVVDPNNPNLLQLSASSGGPAIALTSHGTSPSQSVQGATLGTTAYSFAPSTVVPAGAANTINLSGPSGLNTGDAVVYDDGGGSDIGGLTNGQTYYAIVDPNNPNQLQLAATAPDATAGNALALTSTGSSSSQAIHPMTLGTASATFTPSNVIYYSGDATDGSVVLGPTNPFHTGDAVVYNDGGGTDVGGLTNGHVYYAIVTTANPGLLKLADSPAHATAGIALPLFSPGSSSTQSFQAVTVATTGSTFGPAAVTPGGVASSVNLGTPNPFHSGDALVYSAGGGTAVGGLEDGRVYYAIIDPANPGLVKLAAGPSDALLGNAIPLTSGGNAAQTFTPVTLAPGDSFGPSGVITAGDVNTIVAATPVGFTNGETVVYDNGGGSDVGGLANGQLYYAVVDPTQPTRLQLAATPGGTPITLTSAGSGSAQQFTAVSIPASGTTGAKAVVDAGGDVRVRADSEENVVSVSAAGAGSGGVAFGASIGSYTLNVTTTADVGSGSTVFAHGNVQVSANDIDVVSLLAGTVTGAGAAAIGAAVGVPVVIKNTNAYIGQNATVDALGTGNAIDVTTGTYTETYAPSSFDPSTAVTVDDSGDAIDLGYNPGFGAGDAVVYDDGGGADVGGLKNGHVYYVILVPSNSHKLKLAATSQDAAAGTAITLTSTGGHAQQSFRKVVPSSHTFDAASKVLTRTAVNTIAVGATNPFTLGAAVVYHNGGGTGIPGLVDGHTYYVITNSSHPTQIQLAATLDDAVAGTALALASGGSSSSQSLTPATRGAAVTFGPSDVTPSTLADTIDLGYAHGFSTGAALVYDDRGGSNTAVGGLTNGQVYYAIVDPSQPDRIALAATPDAAAAGNAIALTPGSGSQSFDAVAAAAQTFDPAATADAAANTIDLGYSHGFTTGQAVDYSNGGGSNIGGLTGGTTYYAIVDPTYPNKLRLAATQADAKAANALLLNLTGTTGSQHAINPQGFAAPSINNPSVTEPGLFSRRLVGADTTALKGVAVTATSRDDVEQMVISGSFAGVVGIPLSASVHVLNNHTNAYIDSGAQVNTDQADPGGGQSVQVAAGSDYYHLGVAGAAGVAGVTAVGAGVDVAVVTLNTLAYVNGGATVDAKDNVAVLSHSKERILSIGVGLALAGGVGVGGSVSVPVVNDTTLAFIGDQDPNKAGVTTVVHAGNNVQVAASDETHALTVDGGVGVGITGGGVGVSVPVVVFTKNTEAYVSNGGDVRGLAGGADVMPVLAGTAPAVPQTFDASSSTVVKTGDNSINLTYDPGFGTGDAVVYDNGGGTNVGGLTGGTTYYAIVDATTPKKLKLAKTRRDALAGNAVTLTATGSGTNQTVKSAGDFRTKAAQGVAVQATSSEDVLTVAVAGGAGAFLGLAGSVAVTVITATTRAFVNDAVVNDPTGVSAAAAQAVSVGAADFARIHTVVPSLAGGLVGVSGAVNVGDVNNDTRAYVGSGATVHALGNVEAFALSNKDFDSTTISMSGGLAALGGAVAVYTLGSALDASSQQSLQDPGNGSGNAGGGVSNLQQVSDASNALGGTHSDPNSSTRVSTGGSGQTSGNSGLVTTGLANSQSSTGTTTTQSNAAGDTLNGSTTPVTGTVAYVGGTSTDPNAPTRVTAGGNVSVQAEETVTANVLVGQGVGGLGGYGAAVAVLNVHSNTQAFLDGDAVVAATGSITVNASLNEKTTSKVYAGVGTLALGVGVEVAVNNDTSTQLAYVGDGARVNQASALSVTAKANRAVESDAGGVTTGVVAIGVASAQATAGGSTVAAVGAGAQVGQTAGASVGSLTLGATNTSSVTVNGLIVASGFVGGGGDNISGTVNPDVLAYVGRGAAVTVTGPADLGATATPGVDVENLGGGNGGITVTAVIASATVGGKTWAFLDQGASLTAGALSVTAVTPSRNATATSKVLNISLGGYNGSNTTSEVGGSVEAFVGRPPSYTFDATSAVDGTGHFITLGTTSLKTGDAVVYGNGGGTSIGLAGGDTLQDGTTYYAIVDPNHPGQVQLADSLTHARNGTALPLLPVSGPGPTQSLTPAALAAPTAVALAGPPSSYGFNSKSAVDGMGHFITLTGSALKTGDAVVYDNGGGTSVGFQQGGGATGALQSGGTYYAIVDPNHPNQVQLAAGLTDALTGNALLLMPASGAGSIQSLSSGTVVIHAESVSNPVANITLGAGGVVSISAAVSDAKADGTTSAYLGDNTVIGTGSRAVNSLTVTAQGTDVGTDTATLGSGGLGAGNGSDTEVHVTPTLTAFLGQNVSANVAHDLQVVATSTAAEAHATANSYGGGFVQVGAPATTVVTAPTVLSSIGVGSTLTVGGNLSVQALAHADKSSTATLTDFIQNVDTAKDTINFPNYGLQNGDLVLYQPGSGTTPIQTPAGSLQQYLTNPDGTVVKDSAGNNVVRTYHVLQVVNTDSQGNQTVDPNDLKLGATFDGGAVDTGNLFATGSGVDPTRNVIRFSGPHGFETGDAVHYVPGTSGVSGLDGTTTYYVRKIDDTTLKLYASRADAVAAPVTFTGSAINDVTNTVTISTGVQDGEVVSYQAPAPLQFPSSGVNVVPQLDSNGKVTGLTPAPTAYNIYVGQNDYQTGDALVYRTSDPANPVGGLADGTTYYVIKDASKPYTIQLAATADDTIVPNPIHLSAGSAGAANAKHFLVRPAIVGLTGGATYMLKVVDATAHTYHLLDSGGNVVKVAAPGWSYQGSAGVAGNNSGFTAGNPAAPQGTQVAFLQQTGSASQPLAFAAGTYKVSFSAAQRKNTQASSQTFRVLVDGTGVGDFTPSGTGYAAYTTNAFTVTAGNHVITFQGLNPNGGDNTAFLDQLSVASTSTSGPAAPLFSDAGFEEPVVGNGYQYNPAGMAGTHQLFKDGVALAAGSGTQELHIDFTAAASPLRSDELLGVGGVSLRALVPSVNATGQSTATVTAEGGGVVASNTPTSTLTTTPTVKAWAAPKLATVQGSVTVASESLANTLASTYTAGGGLISAQIATATTNFGTTGTGGTAAVNEAFVGTEDTAGTVTGSGVQIHAAQGFTLSSLTSLATNPSATVYGGGLGAGLTANATANANNATTTTVGKGAVVAGQTVTILADVQNLGVNAPSTAHGGGLVGASTANSTSNVTSTATALIGGGTTRITGQGGVDVQARHDNFNPILSPSALFIGIGPSLNNPSNNNKLHSHVEADAGATVVAGPPAGSTTALSVQADQGASISNATTDPTIQWDANVIVAAGASPYLLVNGDGSIAKAVNVTVDDSAARGSKYSAITSGTIQSGTVVVNTLNNAGSQVLFSASGGITNSANNPFPLFTFTDTLQGVTVINHSAKALQIGNIDVANRTSTSAPQVLLNNSTTKGNFEFDVQHAVAPSFIDIEQDAGTTSEDINLTGDVENPIGTTTIKDANGNVNNTAGSAQIIRTNVLDVEASASLGSLTNRINADLVQSTDTSTNPAGLRTPQLIAKATNGDVDLNLRARNRTTSASSLTVFAPAVSAGGNVNLQLQSSVKDSGTGGTTGTIHVVDQSDSTLTGDYAAHFHDASKTANATLDQGVYAGTTNNTTTSSTYDFRNRDQGGALTGLAGLSAGGNISVQAANSASTDPTVDIVGVTNLQSSSTAATNHIDVTTNGKIDLTQIGGPMRVGTIQSTNANVTLSVPETANQVEGLTLTGTSSVTAGGNVLLQVGGNVNLAAGSSITARGGNAATPAGTVTIRGDYDNGAPFNPDPGTTFNLFGNIAGASAAVSGDDAGDVFNVGNVSAGTPLTVTGTGSNDTYNVGSNAPASGGVVGNIQGALTVVGDGTATLNVDDTGSTVARTGTLTPTALTGLNMGASGIAYSGLANLNVNLGSGGNTFLINGTAATTSTALNSGTGVDTVNVLATGGKTTVNTGGGSNANVVNVGSTAPATGGIVDNIQGALTVSGNGSDTTNVDDTGSTGQKTGTLTPTTLTGLKMGGGGITYGGLATLNVRLGSGGSTVPNGPVGNTFTINDINSATRTSVDGGVSNNDTGNYNAAADFNGRLDLTAFEHGSVKVAGNFNGTLNDTLPGHLELVQIGGSLSNTGVLQTGSIDTMSVGQDLAGTLLVSGTLGAITIGGSLATTGVLSVGNLNSLTIGHDLAGQLIVTNTLGTLRVYGGTPGTVVAGKVGTIGVYAGYGPVVAQIKEAGTQRRVEAAVPSSPYPVPPPPPAPTPAVSPAGVTFQYFYESSGFTSPQATIRVNNASGNTGPDQYDLSLVTYNDAAKFNLARLDAAGVAGIRNVAVEGDLLKAVSSPATAFFQVPGPNGTTVPDGTPAGVRLPLDTLAGVEVRDYLPAGYVQAKSIQALAFGSYTTTTGTTATGASASASTAAGLLVSGTALVQSNDTYRVPFADLATQQVQLFVVTNPSGGSFNGNGILLTLQSVSSPNAAGTANVVTPSNVARGAVTALVKVQNSVVQSINLRGDGGSIQTLLPFSADGSITSTGPLGDLTLHESQGLYNLTAPSVFGSITIDGPITGLAQTTGQRTDPIASVVTTVPSDLGRLYVNTSGKTPVVTATVVTTGGLSGQLVSRGNLISQVTLNAMPLSGLIAAQGNLGAVFTPTTGSATRLGGVLVNGAYSGEVVVLGVAYGDMNFNGGLKGGRLAVKGGIVGNLTTNGVDATAAVVSGGEIGDATWGTTFTVNGTNKGILAAKGTMRFAKGSPGGNVFNNATGANAAAIDAIFADGGKALAFDLSGLDLGGLNLILADLAALYVNSSGTLAGPKA